MQGVEHDEAISIYALQMQARRLLRRPAVAGLLAMTTPSFFNTLYYCLAALSQPAYLAAV